MMTFKSPDIMRFLGRKVTKKGEVPGYFNDEVITSLKRRREGVRIKHSIGANSQKMYDKHTRLLRVENTMNDPSGFKVYRGKQGDENGTKQWLPMRKGIADLHRRTQVSQAANDRYAEALASVNETTPLREYLDKLCRPTQYKGRRVRALRPYSPEDGELLEVLSQGEFVLNGFRNRDLRKLLYSEAETDKAEERRRSGAVTRKFVLLRAHKLLKKVPRTHRYQLTGYGRRVVTALSVAREADVEKLTKLAA